jgi:hypothetical protein
MTAWWAVTGVALPTYVQQHGCRSPTRFFDPVWLADRHDDRDRMSQACETMTMCHSKIRIPSPDESTRYRVPIFGNAGNRPIAQGRRRSPVPSVVSCIRAI